MTYYENSSRGSVSVVVEGFYDEHTEVTCGCRTQSYVAVFSSDIFKFVTSDSKDQRLMNQTRSLFWILLTSSVTFHAEISQDLCLLKSFGVKSILNASDIKVSCPPGPCVPGTRKIVILFVREVGNLLTSFQSFQKRYRHLVIY